MFKKLLIALVALTGMAYGQAVHTPTLEGNYTWTGQDLFAYGNLGFTSAPTPCGTDLVMKGFNADFSPICVSAPGGGGVNPGNFGQAAGYTVTGGDTNVSGLAGIYALNPTWSLAQMNGLFARFNVTYPTACAVSSNVATLTVANSFSPGDYVIFEGLTTCAAFNGYELQVQSATATSFTVNFTTSNVSGAETGYLYLAPGVANTGTVIIPQGMVDAPANAFTNTFAKVVDTRKGYFIQQASQYGVKCATTGFSVSLSTASNQMFVGSSLTAANVGDTVIVAQQVGFGEQGLQEDWEPTITAINTMTGYATLSSLPPFNYSGVVTIGVNNQTALQTALNDVGSLIPLDLPQCTMLTDTLRWNGASLVGHLFSSTQLAGFPGHDILQTQDGLPITAWSINATTGVTTFTIPARAAHSILPASLYPANSGLGDVVTFAGFGTSTFFNGATLKIASQPTPTTFTVNYIFGQSTSSGTEAGVAQPTVFANSNGVIVTNVQFDVNNAIDPSYAWNHYDASGNETVEPPYYRPLLNNSVISNNPFGSGWGTGQVNGIAKIAQNTNVICVSTTMVGGNTPRLPGVGTTILFPYQGDGAFSATVNSTAGSCSSGFTPFTLSANLPNNAAFTAAQAEWFTFTTAQTLASSMPTSITLPYTITLSLPMGFVPAYESNVGTHGHIIINGDEWDYMGVTYGGTSGGSPTLIIRNGPSCSAGTCSVNGGAGDASGSVVFPMNPCAASYDTPWPVVPSLNAVATPVGAVYYPGICGGNAAIALPSVDALAWTSFSDSGLSLAHFTDVSAISTTTNSNSAANNNGSMFMYQAGNNTGYGNTFDGIRVSGLWGGFMQGPSSANQYEVAVVGPTSTGQSIKNCTFRTAYSVALIGMAQSNIDRCDTYSTLTSPYDGTVVGASTDFFLGSTINEKTGAGVTGTYQFTIKDYNGEPESGNHEEIPPSLEADSAQITWIGNIFEGGFNIFGGSFQSIHNAYIAGPVFNYGTNNYFDDMTGLLSTYNDSGVYDGTIGFYNWGSFSNCQSTMGAAGLMSSCGINQTQTYNGHDAFASMFGNNVNPDHNLLGGMISPDEFGLAGATVVFDSTELWYAKHFECGLVASSGECLYSAFGGFDGYVLIGPKERLINAPMVLKFNVKAKNSGNLTASIGLTAQNALSSGACTPNFSLANATFTALTSGWTSVQIPVDLTGTQGCAIEVEFDGATTTNVLEVGYFNFIPFPGQMYMPLGTPTLGAACPVTGEFMLDTTYEWLCVPGSGHAFGTGTWAQIAVTK